MNKLDIKPGDYVIHNIGKEELELVKTITHQNHGIRDSSEEYCCINGLYWRYDDIKAWYIIGIDPHE